MKLLAPTLAAAAVILSGCAGTASYDYERSALERISRYESFTIVSPKTEMERDGVLLSPIVDRRIERSIKQQLSQSGFEENVSDPDFRVTFRTMANTRTDYTEFPAGIRRGPAFHGYYGSYLDISEFEEGIYVIDIVDGPSNELVWRGSYRKRLRTHAPDEAEIEAIVEAILTDFPPPVRD